MKNKLGACLLSILLLLTVLAGCGADAADTTPASTAGDTEPVPSAPRETTMPLETTEPKPVVPVRPEEILGDGYVTVRTLYGDLRYQDQWQGYMLAEQRLEGDVLTVSFFARIGEAKYPLFVLAIGGAEGIVAGQLTGSDGITRNVCVSMDAIVESSELSDGELSRLYAMQEDVNYMINYLE